ncbi:hypothetical protein BN1723_002858 [Verticillium longisporum]|uniref:Uncharacterized protein n=1 Tax=Verticillium longisporum TaxID=100787 RepID=A0A0G4LKH1_VERLO|nr:hypothetical protein BN1723_002858 [Verticillium longisporum]
MLSEHDAGSLLQARCNCKSVGAENEWEPDPEVLFAGAGAGAGAGAATLLQRHLWAQPSRQTTYNSQPTTDEPTTASLRPTTYYSAPAGNDEHGRWSRDKNTSLTPPQLDDGNTESPPARPLAGVGASRQGRVGDGLNKRTHAWSHWAFSESGMAFPSQAWATAPVYPILFITLLL